MTSFNEGGFAADATGSTKEFAWTEEEMHSVLVISNWYAEIVRQRGHDPADHPLRALLGVAMETFVSSQQYDEIAKLNEQAQLDPDTVANLTSEPATAEELAAVCGVLASTLGANSGIVNVADLDHHRALTVANVLAQVRLRNRTEHLGGSYVQ